MKSLISFTLFICAFSTLELNAQSFHTPDWVVVMSKDSTISNQIYFVSGGNYFPLNSIKKYTSQGYSIDQFAGRGGKTFLVLTKYKNYTPIQDYKVFKGNPATWIRDRRKDGYRPIIYSPFYSRNKVRNFVVMNKERVDETSYIETLERPSIRLTETVRCPERVFHSWEVTFGIYHYVWSNVSIPYTVGIRDYFPSEYFDDERSKGLMIKSVSLGYISGTKGGWDFILVKNPNWSDQVYYYKDISINNPYEWIKSNMDKGYFITSIF